MSAPPTDKDLHKSADHARQETREAIKELDEMVIDTINFITSFKILYNATICMSNRYYAKYGALFTVDNVSWSADRILQICGETLRDKVREGMIVLSALERCVHIVQKLILDIVMDVVMDVDKSSLHLFT